MAIYFASVPWNVTFGHKIPPTHVRVAHGANGSNRSTRWCVLSEAPRGVASFLTSFGTPSTEITSVAF